MNHKSHPSQNPFLISLILRFGRFSTDSFIAIRGLRSILSAAVSADRPHGRHISSSASGTVFIRPDLPNHHPMDYMMIYLFWYNPSMRSIWISMMGVHNRDWCCFICQDKHMASRRIVVYSHLPSCHGPINHRSYRFETDLFRTLWVWYTLTPLPEYPWCVWFHCRDIFTYVSVRASHHLSVIYWQLILKWYPGGSLDGITEWIIL